MCLMLEFHKPLISISMLDLASLNRLMLFREPFL